MLRRALGRCVLNASVLDVVKTSPSEGLFSLKSRFFNDDADVAAAMGSVAPPEQQPITPPNAVGGVQGRLDAQESGWGTAMPRMETDQMEGHFDQFSPDKFHPKILEDEPSEELVEQYLGSECKSSAQKWKDRQQQARHDFKRHETDCGSSEVQVAILTERIQQMQNHLTTHRKDFSSRRGLERMLNTRRKLLIYLRKKDFDKYCITIGRLNLKDIYVRQDRYAIYRTAKELQRKKLN